MSSPTVPAPSVVRERADIASSYTWDLSSIFPSWPAWEKAYHDLEQAIERYRSHEGRLAESGERLLQAYQDADVLGQLAYRVWYFAALHYDEDQRDNAVAARRQRCRF